VQPATARVRGGPRRVCGGAGRCAEADKARATRYTTAQGLVTLVCTRVHPRMQPVPGGEPSGPRPVLEGTGTMHLTPKPASTVPTRVLRMYVHLLAGKERA
jgi:hypothetical protein